MSQKQEHRWLVVLILAILDISILLDVFHLSVFIRNSLTPFIGLSINWQSVASIVSVATWMLILVFAFAGLYPGYGLTSIAELQRVSRAVMVLFFFLIATAYLDKPFQEIPRTFLVLSLVLSWAALPLGRFAIRRVILRCSWYGLQVVVFGEDTYSKQMMQSLQEVRRLGWQPTMICSMEMLRQWKPSKHRFDVAIFVPSATAYSVSDAYLLSKYFHRVVVAYPTNGFGSVWVEPRDLNGQLGLEFCYHLLRLDAVILKCTLDLLGALLGLIFLSPFFALLAALIKLDSPGPVFFRQERIGKNFKPFKVIKFRTMAADAEQKLQTLLRESSDCRAEFERYHKLHNDPRITRLGKFLRRAHLDEFPQLWNVLVGEMSLVGPRPVLAAEVQEMGEYAAVVLRVKPGMTGWWQVTGKHDVDYAKRIQLEGYYISNWSLWMDFYILLKTVGIVLTSKGL